MCLTKNNIVKLINKKAKCNHVYHRKLYLHIDCQPKNIIKNEFINKIVGIPIIPKKFTNITIITDPSNNDPYNQIYPEYTKLNCVKFAVNRENVGGEFIRIRHHKDIIKYLFVPLRYGIDSLHKINFKIVLDCHCGSDLRWDKRFIANMCELHISNHIYNHTQIVQYKDTLCAKINFIKLFGYINMKQLPFNTDYLKFEDDNIDHIYVGMTASVPYDTERKTNLCKNI